MRKLRQFLLGPKGQTHCYHAVSRFAGRHIVFGEAEREFCRILLRRQLRFSGLRCLAWCCMGNHFHLLLEVPDKEQALAGWTQEDLLQRLRLLANEPHTRKLLAEVAQCKKDGDASRLAEIAESVRERLFDLSRFMQEFKHKFSVWFNGQHDRQGTVWEERFKSVLVEGAGQSTQGPGGLAAVAAYIDLNAVRAGLVDDPADYRWSSYGEAAAGDAEAREGLAACLGDPGESGKPGSSWSKVGRQYRMLLYLEGEQRPGGLSPEGWQKAKRGFTRAEVEKVLKAGGKLPLAVALRCRVRYFTEGVALGRAAYLEGFFKARRELFSAGRKEAAREMRGADWGELRTVRDLRKDAVRLE